MTDHLTIERFSMGTVQDWKIWLEDYCIYGQLKKWNSENLATNLRFFVSGDIKCCVRQACEETPTTTLEAISAAVVKLLGGTPDPLIAVRQLESVSYNGNVGQTLLSISDLIPLAYPTITERAHRDQMTWIHLQKLLPTEYQRDLIKAGVDQLDAAVDRIRAFERADAAIRLPPAGLYRTQSSTEAASQSALPEPMGPQMTCYVCGLPDHVRNSCPFRQDICGQCERRGHLSTVCRLRPRQPRGRAPVPERSWGNGRQSVPRGSRQTVFRGSTVAPLTWTGEDQTPTPTLPFQPEPLQLQSAQWIPAQQQRPQRPEQLQQLPAQPRMPPPPPPEPQQRPELQPTLQQPQRQQ